MKKPRYLLSAAIAILLLGLPFSATPQFPDRSSRRAASLRGPFARHY